jgi:exopolyphosphatase/guanosine-5'-triphosphate,3'-diphosphate pyrophosphatase
VRAAVIGIGSNSIRLLVADRVADGWRDVARERREARLFAGLCAGALTAESMEAACAAVCDLTGQARTLGAESIRLFATSATRDAVNADAFQALLRERIGLALDICTGEEEALLSYAGATQPGLCGVVDIGGGSTEWIVGLDGRPLTAVSQQMGAVRLLRELPIGSEAELARAVDAAAAVLRTGLAALSAVPAPSLWIGVGGIFAALAAMDRRVDSFDGSLVEGYTLTAARVSDWAQRLSDMPMEVRRGLPGLPPQRADIIAHGAAILMACLRLLDAPAITVTNRGNLDGYLRKKVASKSARQVPTEFL